MPPSPRFTTPLSVSSQFPFCGLPLRLDSYRGCGFQCTFCFARYRGGNSDGRTVRPARPEGLAGVFARALGRTEGRVGIVGEFLRHRVPVHFGGMGDPFEPAEERFGVTAAFLRTLAEYRYPTVISTRSGLVAKRPYLDVLKAIGKVVVQFSFSTTRDEMSSCVEPLAPPPSERLRAMERLARAGIHITCRWQPYIPGLSEPPEEFVPRVASAGCRHVGLEHLKLPVERGNPLWKSLINGLGGRDLNAEYREAGARRDGREYVLPPEAKLRRVQAVATEVRARGMTFGAADNEFQYLSDTDCCCSGVDQFEGFDGWFKHQIATAMRRCRGRSSIVYGAIARDWAPDGSIDRYLNSHSRIGDFGRRGATIRDHVIAKWNDPASPMSPATFYGVVPTQGRTPDGQLVYRWATDLDGGYPST